MIAIDLLIVRAERLAAAGEREGAAWALYRAASGAADGTRAAAWLEQALAWVDGLTCDRLRGSIAALAAELAYEAGDVMGAVAASRDAEARFQRAGDARGFLAVWTARALRALRVGDAEAGLTMTRWILPWLDQVAEPAPRIWLRLYAGEAELAADDVEAAVGFALDVLELAAAGSDERLLATELLVRALVGLDRRDDGVRAALVELERLGGDDGLRSRLYRTVALILADSDPGLARACHAAAEALGHAPAPTPTPRAVVSPLLA